MIIKQGMALEMTPQSEASKELNSEKSNDAIEKEPSPNSRLAAGSSTSANGKKITIDDTRNNQESLDEAATPTLSKRSAGGFGQFVTQSEEDGSSIGSAWLRKLRLIRFLRHPLTQSISACFVMLTVALIIFDTNARAKGSKASLVEDIVMFVCFVVYVIEFGLTVFVEGKHALSDAWNYIDILVILTSLVDYILSFMQLQGFELLRLLRICRLLRLGRLMRALKLLQRVGWLKEQYILCMMMASCLRTLCWAFLLCFFVMTLWSILAVELLNDIVQDLAENDPSLWESCSRCPRSFSSIWESNWTFFQTIVAGDSWGLVALPVIEKHAWTSLVLVGALASIVFGVLNLIAAVVIDTFAERRAKDISHQASELEYEEVQEKKLLAKIFTKIDEDQSGALSIEELQAGANKVRDFQNYLRVLDIDNNDLADLFVMIDYDGSGEVDSDEFIEALYRMKHTDPKTATRFVKHMLANMFEKHDVLKERLDGIQNNVLERLTSVESRLVSDLEDTVSQGNASQKEVQGLLDVHVQRIDDVVSKAIENAAAVTLNAAMDSAVAKASQAIRQVVRTSSSRTAAISDRVDQICSLDSEADGFSRQASPQSEVSESSYSQDTRDSHGPHQSQGARRRSLIGASLFKLAQATFAGPSWVASRPVRAGARSTSEVPAAGKTPGKVACPSWVASRPVLAGARSSSEVPAADKTQGSAGNHLSTSSFDSMITQADVACPKVVDRKLNGLHSVPEKSKSTVEGKSSLQLPYDNL